MSVAELDKRIRELTRQRQLAYIESLKHVDENTYNAIVFEGGGTHGAAQIGALVALHERGLLKHALSCMGGSSVGALTAAFLAVGYSPLKLQDAMRDIQWRNLLCDSPAILGAQRLVTQYGWHEGDAFLEWIREMIDSKLMERGYKGDGRAITFSELFRFTGVYLMVTVCSLNRQRVLYMDHLDYPTDDVATAVRRSCSIPFLLVPGTRQGELLVDGGLWDNFPKHHFDKMGKRAIGISMPAKLSNLDCGIADTVWVDIDTPTQFAYAMFRGTVRRAQQTYRHHSDESFSNESAWDDVVRVDMSTCGVSPFKFSLTSNDITDLEERGKRAVVDMFGPAKRA